MTAERQEAARRKPRKRPQKPAAPGERTEAAAAQTQASGKEIAPAIPVLEDVLEIADPETGEEKEEEPEMPPLPLSTLDDAQLQTLMQNLAHKMEQQIASLATVVRINFMRELREQFLIITRNRSEPQERDSDKTLPPSPAPADGTEREEPK
ncbi:MAG: hypothetical protein OXU54_00570 [Gammaproteobacteria bacterium]|nr:hypothetical protein [Gammaproteobacteria bacterium]